MSFYLGTKSFIAYTKTYGIYKDNAKDVETRYRNEENHFIIISLSIWNFHY